VQLPDPPDPPLPAPAGAAKIAIEAALTNITLATSAIVFLSPWFMALLEMRQFAGNARVKKAASPSTGRYKD
jgi:hypothetical protein